MKQDRVEVRTEAGRKFVVATAAFAVGDAILALDGEVVREPSRYSLQIDRDRHVVAPDESSSWRFLNHSCVPCAALRDRTVVALRAIAVGEEITLDYDASEYEMAEPFACRCGTCGGREVGGFARLSPDERLRRAPLLAPHLKRLLDQR